ncbi:uncharacterized protein LOC135411335 isoform X3 [Pseudopipra pipra]|uniref:uncharacterized protein LOC135411335 isoform X3 n=1 Tax=Pseudopipra pipra TaxID=415032 RepID=UPI00313996A3
MLWATHLLPVTSTALTHVQRRFLTLQWIFRGRSTAEVLGILELPYSTGKIYYGKAANSREPYEDTEAQSRSNFRSQPLSMCHTGHSLGSEQADSLVAWKESGIKTVLSDPGDETTVLPEHMPWGHTMGWVRDAALPGPLATHCLGDVS